MQSGLHPWRLTRVLRGTHGGSCDGGDVRLDLARGLGDPVLGEGDGGGEASRSPASRRPAGTARPCPHRRLCPGGDGTYPDPYYGMNLREIPGTSYKISHELLERAMPADSRSPCLVVPHRVHSGPREGPAGPCGLRLDGVNFKFDACSTGKGRRRAKRRGLPRPELDVSGAATPERTPSPSSSPPRADRPRITFVTGTPCPPTR